MLLDSTTDLLYLLRVNLTVLIVLASFIALVLFLRPSAFRTRRFKKSNTDIKVDSVWVIPNVCFFGLHDYMEFDSEFEHKHFVRNETLRMYEYLQVQLGAHQCIDGRQNSSVRIPRAELTGTSGVGKSTLAIGWFQHQTLKRIWIHRESLGTGYWIVKCAAGVNQLVYETTRILASDVNILETVEVDTDIVVFDGEHEWISDHMTLLLERSVSGNRTCPFFVVVKSGQPEALPIALSRNFDLGDDKPVLGFTKAEFIKADVALNMNLTASQIDEKWFLFGGSARLFFGSNEVGKRVLKSACTKVENIKYLSWGLVGGVSADAVNTLICYTTYKDITILSEYVSRLLSKYADMDFIRYARACHTTNRDHQGWVAEMEFLWKARGCLRNLSHLKLFQLRAAGTKKHPLALSLKITDVVDYDQLTDLNTIELIEDSGVLFIPESNQNASFDAAYVLMPTSDNSAARPKVYFFQCTIARSHSHNMENCANFLQKLWPLPEGNRISRSSAANKTLAQTVKVAYVIATRKYKYEAFKMGAPENEHHIHQFDGRFGTHAMMKVYFDE